MRSKKQNQGELAELKVSIEKEVVEVFEQMAIKTGMSLAELVVIALKRFRHHHVDYEKAVATDDL